MEDFYGYSNELPGSLNVRHLLPSLMTYDFSKRTLHPEVKECYLRSHGQTDVRTVHEVAGQMTQFYALTQIKQWKVKYVPAF
jgi:hypothetical protein